MRSAVLLALAAILLWSFLALFGANLNNIPALFVVGMALCVGGLVGLPGWRGWRVPWRTLLVGVGGIFGYHFLYFSAFRLAPAVEANLINYLWPLLIVLLSPLILPGYSLRPYHLLGALLGLTGAGLIISGGRLNLDLANLPGYLLAAGAALTWAIYSLLTKRLPPFSTQAVGGFCLLSGLLALAIFALSGQSLAGQLQLVQGLRPQDWLALLAAGIGPMGAAFYTWDAAMKRGDPRIVGSLAYLTPLLSTVNLVLVGGRALSWISGLAMLLIVGGALVGSLDLWRKPAADHPAVAR